MIIKILLSIAIVGIAMAMIAIRIIFVKGGEFRGTCAVNSPFLKDQLGDCSVCGKSDEEKCKYDHVKAKA